jgi:CRISPR/Cas system CSM-associated protein Csm2 small subunit
MQFNNSKIENQITTIQIREIIKSILERLKEKPNESYEDVIINLLREK